MRFFFAAFVALFNGTDCPLPPCAPGYPLHFLPESDPCSYSRAGWSVNEKSICFRRWRGKCWHPPCTLDARGGARPFAQPSTQPTFGGTMGATQPPPQSTNQISGFGDGRTWRVSFEWLTVSYSVTTLLSCRAVHSTGPAALPHWLVLHHTDILP